MSIAMGILESIVAVILEDVLPLWIWSQRYFWDFEFLMIVLPILIGLAPASFNISLCDSCIPFTTNLDLEVLARSYFDSTIRPTSLAPFLSSSSLQFILEMSSWKIKLFNSSFPTGCSIMIEIKYLLIAWFLRHYVSQLGWPNFTCPDISIFGF